MRTFPEYSSGRADGAGRSRALALPRCLGDMASLCSVCERHGPQDATVDDDEMVFRFDLDARITYMNEAAKKGMLAEGQDGLGMHFSEFIASDHCRAYLNALCQSADLFGNLGSIAVRPVVARRPGGGSFAANMRIRECSRSGKSCFVAYIRNVQRPV